MSECGLGTLGWEAGADADRGGQGMNMVSLTEVNMKIFFYVQKKSFVNGTRRKFFR